MHRRVVVSVAQRGVGSRWRVFHVAPDARARDIVEKEEARRPMLETLRTLFGGVFLPKGYPQSVAPSYARYSMWHFGHSVAGSATGGTHAFCLYALEDG